MTKTCPISIHSVDANQIRVISALVALTSILYISTGSHLFIMLLVYDFSFRAIRYPKFSPFFIISNLCIKLLQAPKICDEAPKRFALFLGLSMSLLIFLLDISNISTVASVVASILIFCALLEAIFEYCIGCKLYYALQLTRRDHK